MAISFGISRLRGLTNGWETGCAITTGGTDGTAMVASGYVWICGKQCKLSGGIGNKGGALDLSSVCAKDTGVYLFAKLAAGESSTATLDATSIDPRPNGWAVLGILPFTTGGAANSIGVPDLSGCTGHRAFGRAQNCNLTISYDQAVARGGTLVFGNDMKMYNGSIEGQLEYASISGANLASILGAVWASGGAGSGTMTLTATQQPVPFAIEAQAVTNGVTSTVTILKCYSNQITANLERENYNMPTVSFQAVAGPNGDILTWNI